MDFLKKQLRIAVNGTTIFGCKAKQRCYPLPMVLRTEKKFARYIYIQQRGFTDYVTKHGEPKTQFGGRNLSCLFSKTPNSYGSYEFATYAIRNKSNQGNAILQYWKHTKIKIKINQKKDKLQLPVILNNDLKRLKNIFYFITNRFEKLKQNLAHNRLYQI